MPLSIEPYRMINTPKELNLCAVDIQTPEFSKDHAVTIAANAPVGGAIIVIAGRIDASDYEVFEGCKICFDGFDHVVYANIERDKVIVKDNTNNTYRTYLLEGALDDDKGIPGDIELYLAAQAWLKKQEWHSG
jgi:hypothetical protein